METVVHGLCNATIFVFSIFTMVDGNIAGMKGVGEGGD